MVDLDQQSRVDRVKWLLGRYPDITPEEAREITVFVKHSPALDIALFEMDGEVKPVLGRFKQDHQRDFGISAPHWVAIGAAMLSLLFICYLLWDSAV